MSEQEDAIQAWRERAASFTEAELVTWSFVFEHMAAIEGHLQELTGRRPPDAEVAAIVRILAWELKKRTSAKGPRREKPETKNDRRRYSAPYRREGASNHPEWQGV